MQNFLTYFCFPQFTNGIKVFVFHVAQKKNLQTNLHLNTAVVGTESLKTGGSDVTPFDFQLGDIKNSLMNSEKWGSGKLFAVVVKSDDDVFFNGVCNCNRGSSALCVVAWEYGKEGVNTRGCGKLIEAVVKDILVDDGYWGLRVRVLFWSILCKTLDCFQLDTKPGKSLCFVWQGRQQTRGATISERLQQGPHLIPARGRY